MVIPVGRNAAMATGEADPADGGPVGQQMRPLFQADLALADEGTIRDDLLPAAIGKLTDPDTDDDVVSPRDGAATLYTARSIVGVTSTGPDGGRTFCCTGMLVGVDETGKRARILTASAAVCTSEGILQDPKPKLSVCLPNGTVLEGHLLFFNDHYGLALVDIMVDFEPTLPFFGARPQYGQEVFVLARDTESYLKLRRGTILFREGSLLGRNHSMFLSCEIPECGTGGVVIDHDGMVTGMVFCHSPETAFIASSTILICIKMWTQYSLITRPVLGMHLRSMDLLDISRLDKLSNCYNINKGFIVDQVTTGSTAEIIGIRRGDVIEFHELCGSTLPQLEEFLLSRAWEYMHRNIDACMMVDFKVEVHDLLRCARTSIVLTVGLTDASEWVEYNWNKLGRAMRMVHRTGCSRR